jgi:hypothetical protein
MQEYGHGIVCGNVVDVDGSLFDSRFGDFEFIIERSHRWNMLLRTHLQ